MRTRLGGPPGKDMPVMTYTGGRKMSAVLFASMILGALLVCSLMVTRASVASTLPTGVVAGGHNFYGETDVPAGLHDAEAVSAGNGFSVALDGDGTVVAWGNNYNGQTDVPDELKDPQTSHVVDISSEYNHSLALKDDGTVVGWGGGPPVPDDLKDPQTSHVAALSAGNGHSLALKDDGTVVAWGDNTYGQSTVPAEAQSGVKAIDAGGTHNLVLKEDGTVVPWGYDWGTGATDVPQDLGKVKAIVTSDVSSLALKEDGTLAAWGGDDLSAEVLPDVLKDPQTSHVRAITVGQLGGTAFEQFLALREDGTVVGWNSELYWNPEQGYDAMVGGLNEVVDVDSGGRQWLLLNKPTPPGPVDYFEAGARNAEVSLSWSNPTDADFQGVRVLRSTTGPATSPVPSADQTQVYEGKGESYTDTGLTNGITYYYTAYTTDDAGLWSQRSARKVTPVAVPDTTAPKVDSVVPAENATGVGPRANVSAFFSEAMRAGSINTNTFKLFKAGTTTPLATQVSYDASTKKATLNPNANLLRGAKYKAVVSAGTKDVAGNQLDQNPSVAGNQPKVWFFTVRN